VPTPTVIEVPAADILDVIYEVSAGPRVDFGAITVKGLKAVQRDFIEKRLLIHFGEQFSPRTVEKMVHVSGKS
jgi:translocation and assembly module TamA